MATLDELKAERDELEAHMGIWGGCRQQMFLGDCPTCARYWELDDVLAKPEAM
jgi:hypothetical protein